MLPHEAAPDRFVDSIQLSRGNEISELAPTPRGFALPKGTKRGDCVRYRIPLSKLRGVGAPNRTRQYGNDWLLCADYWLWHSSQVSDLPLRFDLPQGTSASFPWKRTLDGYLVPADAHRWKSVGALGALSEQRLSVGGFRLQVATLGDATPEPYLDWLASSARAASQPFRGDPPIDALVVLAPEPSREDSFGFAFHGGGRSSLIWAANSATKGDIGPDWAATHELFHLLMPYTRLEDAWFSEGITTYYTAILRGRAGALSDLEVWWELVDGFERGSQVAGDLPLQEESEQMHQHRSYWRVYWAGAAIALAWELELHKAGKSLDDLMRTLGGYARETAALWSAEELMIRADKDLGASLWAIAEPALASSAFFDYQPLLDELGVHGDSRHLRLRKGKLAALRESLTRSTEEPAVAGR